MPRTSRVAPGGYVYHVLNRGVGRRHLFDKPADFQAFEAILAHTLELAPIRVLAYGRESCVRETAVKLGLESTLRARGRPRRVSEADA